LKSDSPVPAPAADEAATAEDERWMRHALALATRAEAAGEVPVGACLVRDGVLLGEGWNQPISAHDPTAHAEVVALRSAAAQAASYRLVGTTLYVTLEPCAMCAGAIVHARVRRLVYGARDPKTGAAGSVFDIVRAEALNHRLACTADVLAADCGHLLRKFFAARR
jgi:tRNA(adenine34) deaminase